MDAETRGEMNEYDKAIQELVAEGIEVNDQIARLLAEYENAKEAAKDGKMSAVDYIKLISKVEPELDEARAHYASIVDRVKDINEKQNKLRKDHKVPWWHILLTSGLGITTALSSAGVIKLNGLSKAALNGARVLVKNIELGSTQEEIKAGVKSARNDVVNSIVKELYEK